MLNKVNKIVDFHLGKKISTVTGFEPVLVTQSGFESDALTARPNCHTQLFESAFEISRKRNYIKFYINL